MVQPFKNHLYLYFNAKMVFNGPTIKNPFKNSQTIKNHLNTIWTPFKNHLKTSCTPFLNGNFNGLTIVKWFFNDF